MSSAYRDILCSLLLTVSPLMFVLSRIHDASGSVTIAKSKGDSGHPCLDPLVKEKKSEGAPLVITAALGFLEIDLIHSMKLEPILNLCKTRKRKFHSNLSPASVSRSREGLRQV